ncbi:RlpA-like double-psi beta-barrel domain-containing protein [Spirillospora sp. NBC_00431]
MQQRAINVILTGVTGTALAGMLVAGVAAASDDSAPGEKKYLSQEALATGQHKAGEKKSQNSSDKGEEKPGSKDDSASDRKREKKGPDVLLSGRTTASYFWDDGSGVNGDTGAPAGGKPMQKGLFASPSWPMHTKVKVTYKGRSITGFVGDRGPGRPSHKGVMLDLDTYTFRYLLDGEKPKSKYNAGGGEGHLKGVKWEVLDWGPGAGKKGAPRPFGS